jgi:uncharacterized protein
VTDLILHLARFASLLRARGLGIGIGDEIDAASALSLVDLLDRQEMHHALRAALKVRRHLWAVFDATFDEFWRGRALPSAEQRQRPAAAIPRAGVSRGASVADFDGRARADAPSAPTEGDEPGYSPQALLRRRPFDECTPDELAVLERMLAQLAARLALKKSRRLVPTRSRGMVDPRRSLRASLGTGGEPLRLARRTRAVEEAEIVVLCDTSGSMDAYSRFLLAFALALKQVARRTEVFAFNTSLTRLTPSLKAGRIGSTLRKLEAEREWSGGTRIGESLADFVARHAARVLSHRSVVVILSDGLDRGDVGLVADAMRAIRARARRVLWLNPLAGDPRYEPTARAMHAALPFVDRLAPAHDFESLERLLPELTG